jgi:hypothetical protein
VVVVVEGDVGMPGPVARSLTDRLPPGQAAHPGIFEIVREAARNSPQRPTSF